MTTIVLSSEDEDDCIILDEDDRVLPPHVLLISENDLQTTQLKEDESEDKKNHFHFDSDPLQDSSKCSTFHKESEQMHNSPPTALQKDVQYLEFTGFTPPHNKSNECLSDGNVCHVNQLVHDVEYPTNYISKQNNNLVFQRLAAALATALSPSLLGGNDKQNDILSNVEDYRAHTEINCTDKMFTPHNPHSKTNPDKIVTNDKKEKSMFKNKSTTMKKRRGRPRSMRAQEKLLKNNTNPSMEQTVIEGKNLDKEMCEVTSGLKKKHNSKDFQIDGAQSSTTVTTAGTSVSLEKVNQDTNVNFGDSYEVIAENSKVVKKKRGRKLGWRKSQILESKTDMLSQENSNKNINLEDKSNSDKLDETINKKKRGRKRGWRKSQTLEPCEMREVTSGLEKKHNTQDYQIDGSQNSTTITTAGTSVSLEKVNQDTNVSFGDSYEVIAENSKVVKKKRGRKLGWRKSQILESKTDMLSQENSNKNINLEDKSNSDKLDETINKKKRGRKRGWRKYQTLEPCEMCEVTSGLEKKHNTQDYQIDGAQNSTTITTAGTSGSLEKVNQDTNVNFGDSYEVIAENSTVVKKKRGRKLGWRKSQILESKTDMLSLENSNKNINLEDKSNSDKLDETINKKKRKNKSHIIMANMKDTNLLKNNEPSQPSDKEKEINSEPQHNNNQKNEENYQSKEKVTNSPDNQLYSATSFPLHSGIYLKDPETKHVESGMGIITGVNHHNNCYDQDNHNNKDNHDDLNVLSILTGDLENDKEILKEDFLKCYNKVFDANFENFIFRLGDILQQTMKKLEPYLTIEDLESVNEKNIIDETRTTFCDLFHEVLHIVFSNDNIFQHKALMLALFTKIFLRVITISPEFLNSLILAKKTMIFLLRDYISTASKSIYDLLHKSLYENDLDFERNCWLILEFCLTSLTENEDSLANSLSEIHKTTTTDTVFEAPNNTRKSQSKTTCNRAIESVITRNQVYQEKQSVINNNNSVSCHSNNLENIRATSTTASITSENESIICTTKDTHVTEEPLKNNIPNPFYSGNNNRLLNMPIELDGAESLQTNYLSTGRLQLNTLGDANVRNILEMEKNQFELEGLQIRLSATRSTNNKDQNNLKPNLLSPKVSNKNLDSSKYSYLKNLLARNSTNTLQNSNLDPSRLSVLKLDSPAKNNYLNCKRSENIVEPNPFPKVSFEGGSLEKVPIPISYEQLQNHVNVERGPVHSSTHLPLNGSLHKDHKYYNEQGFVYMTKPIQNGEYNPHGSRYKVYQPSHNGNLALSRYLSSRYNPYTYSTAGFHQKEHQNETRNSYPTSFSLPQYSKQHPKACRPSLGHKTNHRDPRSDMNNIKYLHKDLFVSSQSATEKYNISNNPALSQRTQNTESGSVININNYNTNVYLHPTNESNNQGVYCSYQNGDFQTYVPTSTAHVTQMVDLCPQYSSIPNNQKILPVSRPRLNSQSVNQTLHCDSSPNGSNSFLNITDQRVHAGPQYSGNTDNSCIPPETQLNRQIRGLIPQHTNSYDVPLMTDWAQKNSFTPSLHPNT